MNQVLFTLLELPALAYFSEVCIQCYRSRSHAHAARSVLVSFQSALGAERSDQTSAVRNSSLVRKTETHIGGLVELNSFDPEG
jgi:hypothetical protein